MTEKNNEDYPVRVYGAGIVGMTTAILAAHNGYEVILYEKNPIIIKAIEDRSHHGCEDFLYEYFYKYANQGKIFVCNSQDEDLVQTLKKAPSKTDIICIDVPNGFEGQETSGLFNLIEDIISSGNESIVIRSTITPKTYEKIVEKFKTHPCVWPEFIAQGSAILNTFMAARHVVGVEENNRGKRDLKETGFSVVNEILSDGIQQVFIMSPQSACLAKYASNTFLAARIALINEFQEICESYPGADILDVASAVGADPRIGRRYLRPGIGYGGSCFRKDINAVRHLAGHDSRMIIHKINVSNENRIYGFESTIMGICETVGVQKVLILGQAFKAGTDDERSSPAVCLREELSTYINNELVCFDPHIEKIKTIIPHLESIAEGAGVIVLATDHDEFVSMSESEWRSIYQATQKKSDCRIETHVVDLRHALDGEMIQAAGFTYRAPGRRRA
jgi:UDPglucose 6-dehydrogenase